MNKNSKTVKMKKASHKSTKNLKGGEVGQVAQAVAAGMSTNGAVPGLDAYTNQLAALYANSKY